MKSTLNNLNASRKRDEGDQKDEYNAKQAAHPQDSPAPTAMKTVYRRRCFATNCCDGKYNLKSKIGYIS